MLAVVAGSARGIAQETLPAPSAAEAAPVFCPVCGAQNRIAGSASVRACFFSPPTRQEWHLKEHTLRDYVDPGFELGLTFRCQDAEERDIFPLYEITATNALWAP